MGLLGRREALVLVVADLVLGQGPQRRGLVDVFPFGPGLLALFALGCSSDEPDLGGLGSDGGPALPGGARAGVSGFQIHFSSSDIYTPGDAPDVLVAMNPAALVINYKDERIRLTGFPGIKFGSLEEGTLTGNWE